ncbi:gluconate permease [Alkalihalobacillus alcalophilus ATCC 27647 = CGMCC 1.3604]|uniref:Gluconate permease n=1 Tax=Alkalihalobacillus alcalophilus ATCC 27647 = CGMCC 1.3604 TaxID=1218173 RepID=J8TVA2_ALKAL|nr:gluconate:H+ symporter [Alkalihalobacillus alcalophilus]AFV25646.1 gluconate transporter [Alkalihalobacillus alcalophilus ATCC 27647 = CGMCC 1.3604]KGA98806.1 gluconate permease [Alkalihalobacillus alcalophilus ATCC 27647 = CGMCC 1.3604]MED1560990.1 gluconate:H+ symporter [Alkalihalobacillus alcalophilus]THG88639.1 gluconate permease [Alkalihalobacillus alcalophilus ATCC 27647 = CGMCC 1.3604]
MLTGNGLIFGFVIALIVLFILIIKFKWDAFIALLVTAIGIGLLSTIPAREIPGVIAEGFGGTLTGVGILIGLGIIFGQFLAASGAIEKIANSMLRAFGVKNSPYALAATSTTVAIPVFFDAAFIILNKLVYSLSLKTKISLATFVTILAIGLIVSHSLIIPTPGPLVVADQMGTDIGVFFLYGLLVAIPATLVGGVIYGKFIGKRIPNGNRLDDEKEEVEAVAKASGRKEIPTWLSYAMLALPIVLILSNTVMNNVVFRENQEALLPTIFAIVGDKNSALLISVIVAIFVLKPYIKEDTGTVMKQAFEASGMILLITGAGGAFGRVVQETGLGDLLISMMQGFNMPALLLGFVFAQILRASLGSATVALVTTATIMGPMAVDLGVSPILLGLAICAGGIGLSLPNDSGFWVVSKFGRLSVSETLRVWSIGGFIAGLTALTVIYLLSAISSILPGI